MKSKNIRIIFIIGLVNLAAIFIMLCFLTEKNDVDLNSLKTKQDISWGVKEMNINALRTKVTGKGIKIAVMDSGINLDHNDLNSKNGFNSIKEDTSFIHGTVVAGIISAKDNGFGIVGVAPDAEVYSVKVLDDYGEGDINNIKNGIDWCIDNDIKIINMSFSIKENDEILYNSIKKAINSGIIIVASSSNIGEDVGYPASYKEVISVTAINKKHEVDKNAPKGKIDFCAPGYDIISTSENDNYVVLEGTSVATPFITGVIALILENPTLFNLNYKYTYDDVYNTLVKFSNPLGDKEIYGNGYVSIDTNNLNISKKGD